MSLGGSYKTRDRSLSEYCILYYWYYWNLPVHPLTIDSVLVTWRWLITLSNYTTCDGFINKLNGILLIISKCLYDNEMSCYLPPLSRQLINSGGRTRFSVSNASWICNVEVIEYFPLFKVTTRWRANELYIFGDIQTDLSIYEQLANLLSFVYWYWCTMMEYSNQMNSQVIPQRDCSSMRF